MSRPLRLRRMSSGRISRGGKPKKEWMVWPPTLTAASPVGASTTISSVIIPRRQVSSVDLPVPARPVTNRWPSLSRRKSWAARYSLVGSTPAGHDLAAVGAGAAMAAGSANEVVPVCARIVRRIIGEAVPSPHSSSMGRGLG